ncbi:MAG: type II secretion system F family protein [Actinomycetota bacterium]
MSDLVLSFAMVATFAAVTLAVSAVEVTLAERRRTVRLLQAQVASVQPVNLREQDLSRSFLERILFPLVGATGALARRVTPHGMLERIDHKLVLAGSPPGWTAERVAAFKLLGAVGGAMFALLLGGVGGSSSLSLVGPVVLLGGIGFFGPDGLLSGQARRRQDAIQKALPDTLDLLTISVEAGLGFDAALAHVIQHVHGPLSQEIGRMLQEVQLGMSRVDALRRLSERTDIDELRGFILAVIQADIFGVGVAKVLRAQAKELRTKRRQRAERKAMQTPVKILFPLIFCVLPALFVVIIGPGAIRIMDNFLGI